MKQALLRGEHHCCVSPNPEVKARGWDRQEYNVWDQQDSKIKLHLSSRLAFICIAIGHLYACNTKRGTPGGAEVIHLLVLRIDEKIISKSPSYCFRQFFNSSQKLVFLSIQHQFDKIISSFSLDQNQDIVSSKQHKCEILEYYWGW